MLLVAHYARRGKVEVGIGRAVGLCDVEMSEVLALLGNVSLELLGGWDDVYSQEP